MLRNWQRLAFAFACLLPVASHAQQYPGKNVRMVVPFSAGGPVDVIARVIAQGLTARLGQAVYVDNRPGGGGTVAAEYVANSPADGYTLLVGSTSSLAVAPGLYDKLRYDPIRAFTPVSMVSHEGLALLVNPTLPINNVSELQEYIKSRPGQINFGSPGSGTMTHLVTELFLQKANLVAQHVPYRGGAQSVVANMSNEVQFIFNPVSTSVPIIQSGRLKALGVTGQAREKTLPNVPTIAEAGLAGFDADFWIGIVAPAATPQPAIDKLWSNIQILLAAPETIAALEKVGSSPYAIDRSKFQTIIEDDLKRWTQLAKQAGVTAE